MSASSDLPVVARRRCFCAMVPGSRSIRVRAAPSLVNGVTPGEARQSTEPMVMCFRRQPCTPGAPLPEMSQLPLEIMGLCQRLEQRCAQVSARCSSWSIWLGFEKKYPLATFRRHAAAGIHSAGVGGRCRHYPTHGRTFWRAGRDRARPPERAITATLGQALARPSYSSPTRSPRRYICRPRSSSCRRVRAVLPM